MKATVLTIFLILGLVFNVCAQKANVTISEPTYVKGRTGTKLILGEKDGKIFVVSQYGNNEKNPTLHVETYDAKSLKQSASNKVELSNTESTKSDLEAVTLENQLYIWYSQRYRSKETKELVHQAVLTPVGDGMPKAQKELDYFPNVSGGMTDRITTSIFFKLSQDSTKLIIYNCVEGKEVSKEYKGKTVININVYDGSLKQVLKKEIVVDVDYTPFNNKDFFISNIYCDDNYNITILSYIGNYRNAFAKKRGFTCQYEVNAIYSIKKTEKTAKEILIYKDITRIFPLKMAIDNEGNIVLISFYRIYTPTSRLDGTYEFGTYFTKLNGKDLSVMEEKSEKFSAKILKEIVGSDKKFNFSELESVDIKILDGLYYFIAKTIKIDVITSSVQGSTTGMTTSSSTSYEQDILLYQFSPTGEILWDAIIPRRSGKLGYGFDVYRYSFNNNLPIFFYYDSPANLSKTSSIGLAEAPKVEQAMLVMVTVDETGKWKKQNLTPALKGAKPLNIRDARRTSDGTLIFISGEKEQEKLVKISVTN